MASPTDLNLPERKCNAEQDQWEMEPFNPTSRYYEQLYNLMENIDLDKIPAVNHFNARSFVNITESIK